MNGPAQTYPAYGARAFRFRTDFRLALVNIDAKGWHHPLAGLRFHYSGVSWSAGLRLARDDKVQTVPLTLLCGS